MLRGALLLGALVGALADCYLQYPPGGNNRLDEGGGNRNNNNRLMDTQNNAKGGYGYGGDSDNPAPSLKYMAGSMLTTLWTSQHSCGSENAECQIIIQAMCNSEDATPAGLPPSNADPVGEGPVRDGTNGNTPDPNNPDPETGLHEPASFYSDCQTRERNKGLYTADQNVNNNNGATATRQNPNGNRSGQECPEERDYYPYWHPTPWKDLAVLTNNLALCDYYRSESQNVKAKNYCSDSAHNNEASCTLAGAEWKEMAPFGIDPPDCYAISFTRDNHLGNTINGYENNYTWMIPKGWGVAGSDDVDNCVVRVRYNITTSDTQVCESKDFSTKALCEENGKIWSALYLDSSYNDNVDNGNDDQSANGDQNPPLLAQNPDATAGGFLKDTGGTDSLLELAVNTNQYGRTFQDRTHKMHIQSRPANVGDNTCIHNLNVKGKRGNIVQTYPATEYDYTPADMRVGANDMVHVQWTGNDNTGNNGNNNGEGTNNEDRHNIMQIAHSGKSVPLSADQASMFDVEWEWNPEGGARDKEALMKEFALVKQTGCATDPNNDQARNNCQKLNAAKATVDLGLIKFKPGEYKYMCTRNNNFSNRAQKAKITVSSTPGVPAEPPTNVVAEAIKSGNKDKAKVKVTWSPPGASSPNIGFDGVEYWGKEQHPACRELADYTVEYSTDGGESWVSAGDACSGTGAMSCEIDDLPAGTPVVVRVFAGTTAGWSEPSAVAWAQTIESDASKACRSQLAQLADGSYFSPGMTVAIVFGVLAALLIVAAAVFIIRRRRPPPPPPPTTFLKTAPEAY